MSFFDVYPVGEKWHLGAETGQVPTRLAIEAADEYPAGDFWGSIVEYLFQNEPALAGKRDPIEIDPDAQGLYVYGPEEDVIVRVQTLLEPLATDPASMTAFIETATATGFIFD